MDVLGPDYSGTVTAWRNLVSNSPDAQRLDYLNAALMKQKQALGASHPIVAVTLESMARIYQMECDFDTALIFYKKALAAMQEGDTDRQMVSEIADLHCEIAEVCEEIEEYAASQEHLEQALAMYHQTDLGGKHPQILPTLQKLAEAFHYQEQYEKAVEIFEKVIQGVNFDDRLTENPEEMMAEAHYGIAQVYSDQSQHHEKALEYYNKALEYYNNNALGQKIGGDDDGGDDGSSRGVLLADIKATEIYTAMALLCVEQRAHEKALELYQKALVKIKQKSDEHTAAVYVGMALVYKRLGDYDNALQVCAQALAIWNMADERSNQNSEKSDHKYSGSDMNDDDNNENGDDDSNVADWLSRQMEISKVYSMMASIHRSKGDFEQALISYSEAISVHLNELAQVEDNPYCEEINDDVSLTEAVQSQGEKARVLPALHEHGMISVAFNRDCFDCDICDGSVGDLLRVCFQCDFHVCEACFSKHA